MPNGPHQEKRMCFYPKLKVFSKRLVREWSTGTGLLGSRAG
jgi:hypothetical protein